MFSFTHRSQLYTVRPVTLSELDSILEVYRQCEDFLALGPVAQASMKMVLADLDLSAREHGCFCGIYTPEGAMLGILDFVPSGWHGDPAAAFLSLLMIARPYRSLGIGQAVVAALEAHLRLDPAIKVIDSGVQVNNPRAIQFWQSQGYRIVSGPIDHSDGTTAFDLRKDLA
jgi:ribosomal protein S18 acetylase RimI-like enzyme